VDVVCARIRLYDFHLVSFTDRSQDFSYLRSILSVDDLSSVLRYDYDVILTIPTRMC
jgi:hypothetical protein